MEQYTIKPWEELTISDDYMFKLVMSRKRICKKMIEKILRIPVRDIRYIEKEKAIKAGYDSKGVRLDVYVADDENTIYNIEMQMRRPEGDELFKRTRYYQAMIDADLLFAGQDYDKLNQTYVIFICPFDIFYDGRHKYTFRNRCDEDKNLELGDGAVKMFLSTKGTKDDVEPDVKAFLEYVNGVLVNDEFVKEIDDEIHKVKAIEAERVRYMTYEMKLQEERKLGRKEGLEEGRKQGKAEGLAEGMEKGMEAMAVQMARKALLKGSPLDEIIFYTNLTEEQIQKLATEEGVALRRE